MTKKTVQMYESMNFVDTMMANQIIAENTQKLERGKHSILLAWIGTACSVIGFSAGSLPLLQILLLLAAFVLSIVAYATGGGFLSALYIAGKMGKIAWFIIPYFPIDLIIGLCGFLFGLYAFLFLPIIFVHIHRKQLKKEIEDAQMYLQMYGYQSYGAI